MLGGAGLAQEVRGQHLDRGRGRRGADGADGGGEVRRTAVRQIVAIDRGDDDMREPQLGHRIGDAVGFVGGERRGWPVATLQNAQARVQVSPMIIMVAWRCDQHSPMLGQAASSQTVTRPLARISARVSW